MLPPGCHWARAAGKVQCTNHVQVPLLAATTNRDTDNVAIRRESCREDYRNESHELATAGLLEIEHRENGGAIQLKNLL